MSRRRISAFGICFSILITHETMAASLDPAQIDIVTETAKTICNTVTEARGTKTVTEIQGEVSAKLAGVAGKYVDLGVSGQGITSTEDFDGLTREATAEAFNKDQGCRERVFNKMFDELSESGGSVSLNVAADPDTIGIRPGGFSVVAYNFRGRGEYSVVLESQDVQWVLPSGQEIWEPCIDCRILGGTFSIPKNSEYQLIDNVYMPPELASYMADIGAPRVNLKTVFKGRDEGGAGVTAKAVLTLVPIE